MKGRTGELEKKEEKERKKGRREKREEKGRKKESWWPVVREWCQAAWWHEKEAKMKERKRDNIPEGFLGRTGGGDAPLSTVRAGRW
uniref:Uncharacterized protein n=1 Tax=Fagus sylvatica TaxID=28930 RepID=A0A2N9IYA0_FAGSY